MHAEETPETTVREHVSRHDRIGDLPLVTESARVTDVSAMVHSLVLSAERLGVPPERIESEGFG